MEHEINATAICSPGTWYDPFLISEPQINKLRGDFERDGYAVFGPPALHHAGFRALQDESARQRQVASWRLNPGTGRSAIPQDNFRGHFGPQVRAVLSAPSVGALLREVTGESVEASWTTSCYTYYDFPGSYLSRHCDKWDTCSLTMLIGLVSRSDDGKWPGAGNQLWVWPRSPSTGPARRLTTLSNRIVILDGKRVPHGRPAMLPGQVVAVVSACFRVIS
jgi:hypothetical protein